jgi:S-adenosyl methyltransferase
VHFAQRHLREPNVSFIEATLRDPQTILRAPAVQRLLADGERVLLSCREEVNAISDEEGLRGMLGEITAALPGGSFCLFTFSTHEGMTRRVGAQLARIFEGLPLSLVLRSRAQILRVCEGLTPLDPGLTDTALIWPGRPDRRFIPGPWRAFGLLATTPL